MRMPLTTAETLRACILSWILSALVVHGVVGGNPDAKRLYDDLLSNYNKLVRPVVNTSDVLKVSIKLKLSQLIDVNLKNQIMTTNLWVEQSWFDYKLRWEPKEYGGVQMLHVPSDHIWRPDIVLYNNADGHYEVTLMTKATVFSSGLVSWQPPAVYKSSCEIDVEYFPYDVQTCVLKLGSWTFDGFKVDLRHMDEQVGSNIVDFGVDLSEFYMSVEWDILEVPAVRNEKFYTCCDEPYLDITFNITMRRKTLFYTVNIIIPCMGISFLTVLTFYLPSDSGEKVTLSISILISLHVFFLLVVEIIPPTSLVVPLLGKYLIFAMILVSISICVTVVVLNVHFRSPQTHRMAPWVKKVFINFLPKLLFIKRPQYNFETSRKLLGDSHVCFYPYYSTTHLEQSSQFSRVHSKDDLTPTSLSRSGPFGSCQIHGSMPMPQSESDDLSNMPDIDNASGGIKSPIINNPAFSHSKCPPEIHRSCFCVRFIAEHTKLLEDSTKVKEDWKYVAMVLDRLFLWIFTLAVLAGTAGIILQAPTLYDDRIPIDRKCSEYAPGQTPVGRCPEQ
ncbi:acetylcholine receptor subunit alpha-like isoform X1 [Contarinia nasturtii]|uniref:acetylcholine receptor subunit alpha-like isoform X1 n=1 Tax=Contarinia nasturtii TaxID=265458 RepID=UPI0012D4B6B7|nr:acetylcholine receptor subunit alpha-like isoform X1 [Contarinia nasturtii]XP_031631662.1 acetylcholine receptor subunit alpha-like isoform X1 [Contarinia nasturtii]XP_031631663.1 acetylcholine receptor subunit alpha-like isoform X1 [Contarinia nasturtii]